MTDYFKEISYLMIETNSSCNLACPSCNRERLKELGMREDKYLSLDEFKKNLSLFHGCPLEIVKLEGISEPMLHPEFHFMAEELKRAFPKAFVIVATNCQYNLKRTSFLKTIHYTDMFYLSIDGTEEIFEQTRAGSSWKKLLQFLEDLKNEVSDSDRSSKMHINFTATLKNYLELPKIYQMVEDYGLAGVRINLAQDWNHDRPNPNSFPQEMIEFLKTYKKDIKGSTPWKYDQCFWPNNGAVIDVFGNLRQCIINTSQEPLMNIHDKSLSRYYNESEHYKITRKNLSNNQPGEDCKNCDYLHLEPVLKEIFEHEPSPNQPRKFKRFETD